MGSQDMNAMKKFLLITSVVQVLLGCVVGALAGASRAEAKVREIAAQTVREEWLRNLAHETKTIAAEAAENAAGKAVEKFVVPVMEKQAKYGAEAESAKARLDRLERLEDARHR